jgi:anti-sigma factor RsiW
MTLPANIDFDTLRPEEFEHILPDLFASGSGKVSQDPRLKKFLAANPDCAALVSDLEVIAETARSLFEPVIEVDPSDRVWRNIQSRLREDPELNGHAKQLN